MVLIERLVLTFKKLWVWVTGRRPVKLFNLHSAKDLIVIGTPPVHPYLPGIHIAGKNNVTGTLRHIVGARMLNSGYQSSGTDQTAA